MAVKAPRISSLRNLTEQEDKIRGAEHQTARWERGEERRGTGLHARQKGGEGYVWVNKEQNKGKHEEQIKTGITGRKE